MVISALIVGGAGLFTTAVGAAGYAGKLIRLPSTTFTGNYGGHLLLGLAMIAAAIVNQAGSESVLGMAMALPTVVLLALGLYASLVRPLQWTVPAWQREMDEAERRRRR